MSVGRGRQLDLEVTDPVELGEDSGQGVLGLVSGCGFGVGIEEIVDGFEKRFEESEERLGHLPFCSEVADLAFEGGFLSSSCTNLHAESTTDLNIAPTEFHFHRSELLRNSV
ncbi:hypothetical protein OIU84_028205 [Salix udensis]|uniref:Uncharacterized protein n=1 Tax=Salix udensis TaxID=889485 RepID=A0AAD6P952_9ROSI|nr:hypothetical protein OIU84_028205 [Salix udensis]